MGNLLICPEGFIFDKSGDENLNLLSDFLQAGFHARKENDHTYLSTRLQSYEYPWGNFYTDFFYSNKEQISQNASLNWISQGLHQMLAAFMYANPSGHGAYVNLDELETDRVGELNGLMGCCIIPKPPKYVSCVPSWYLWRKIFYQRYPERFVWLPNTDDFLPNKDLTNEILRRELIKHQVEYKLADYENNIGLTFHEEVMRLKGPELRAYSIDIGSEVLDVNFYTFDETLSRNEQAAWNNAPRKIYKFINRTGHKQYISIDFAHGMFEYFDRNGNHLGEKRFDGFYNSDPDPTHNLRTL